MLAQVNSNRRRNPPSVRGTGRPGGPAVDAPHAISRQVHRLQGLVAARSGNAYFDLTETGPGARNQQEPVPSPWGARHLAGGSIWQH